MILQINLLPFKYPIFMIQAIRTYLLYQYELAQLITSYTHI